MTTATIATVFRTHQLRLRLWRHARTVMCGVCEGVGNVYDPTATGDMLRTWRMDYKVKTSEVARRSKLTPSYLTHLEMGRREWTPVLIERYIDAVIAAMSEVKV